MTLLNTKPVLSEAQVIAMRVLADVYMEQDRADKAVVLLEALYSLEPKQGSILKSLCYAYLVAEHHELCLKMVSAYRKLESLNAQTSPILLIQGRALLALGREQEAQTAMDRYMSLNGGAK